MQEQMDKFATLADLKELVREFTDARQWTPAHDAKNLAMSIAIEAAELMEHFQWGERSEYGKEKLSVASLEEIRMETADVMIYLLSFCQTLGIDLARAVTDKVAINEGRWPRENYR